MNVTDADPTISRGQDPGMGQLHLIGGDVRLLALHRCAQLSNHCFLLVEGLRRYSLGRGKHTVKLEIKDRRRQLRLSQLRLWLGELVSASCRVMGGRYM